MKQCEKLSANCQTQFFETKLQKLEFLVFEFWGPFDSDFRKPISNIFIGFHTPLLWTRCHTFRVNSAELH